MTNLAACLVGLAKQGQVLLGPETARRLSDGYALKALGAYNLKNVVQPVEVWQALEEPLATE